MTERPILFSSPMVRAILDGRKTQTRRVVKPCIGGQAEWIEGPDGWLCQGLLGDIPAAFRSLRTITSPYGAPGDRLYVRETLRAGSDGVIRYEDGTPLRGLPDGFSFLRRYCPGMLMPRWASRLTLEVVSVRVERLNEISEADAEAEGIHRFYQLRAFGFDPKGTPGRLIGETAVEAFSLLWDSINAKRHPWASNPWVWVVEFKRSEATDAR